MKINPNTFFNRPADIVAEALLGMNLCIQKDSGKIEKLVINETEAYMGAHDLACHASKGCTPRTKTMFEPAGTIYVYLIYGVYHMLNIVVEKEGHPAAVLIRGAGQYNGPGKLTKALGIDKSFNGLKIGKKSGVWIESNQKPSDKEIIKTPRIGVDYAGEWAKKELRFLLN